MVAVHTCEAYDRLISGNNNEVTQALENMTLGGFSVMRQLVSVADYTAVPESYGPGSPNQLLQPGMQYSDWSRERTDMIPEAVVAQISPLGQSPLLAPVPALDLANNLRAATEFFNMTVGFYLQSLMSVPAPAPATVPVSAPASPSASAGNTMVPMMLGDREVHIPLERVVPTQGSRAYFTAAAQNGRGIGRSVCRHWLQKRCTYGEKCGFMHIHSLDGEQQQMVDEYLKRSSK